MNSELKKIGQLSLSVFIAFILFFYATSTSYQSTASSSSTSEIYTNTISSVPVSIAYDSDQYFLSGFTSTVSVNLVGSNRVALQKETDESTRSFRVTADLDEAEVGTYTVDLQVEDLPSGVTAILSPATLTIKVGNKVSKDFAIKSNISSKQVADGYEINSVTLGDTTGTVTTDEDTLAEIDHVEAVVSGVSNLKADYKGIATLQVVDSEGNVLPAVASPSEVDIKVTVKSTSNSSGGS